MSLLWCEIQILSLILLIGYVANDYNIRAGRVDTKSVESMDIYGNMDS